MLAEGSRGRRDGGVPGPGAAPRPLHHPDSLLPRLAAPSAPRPRGQPSSGCCSPACPPARPLARRLPAASPGLTAAASPPPPRRRRARAPWQRPPHGAACALAGCAAPPAPPPGACPRPTPGPTPPSPRASPGLPSGTPQASRHPGRAAGNPRSQGLHRWPSRTPSPLARASQKAEGSRQPPGEGTFLVAVPYIQIFG